LFGILVYALATEEEFKSGDNSYPKVAIGKNQLVNSPNQNRPLPSEYYNVFLQLVDGHSQHLRLVFCQPGAYKLFFREKPQVSVKYVAF